MGSKKERRTVLTLGAYISILRSHGIRLNYMMFGAVLHSVPTIRTGFIFVPKIKAVFILVINVNAHHVSGPDRVYISN